MDVTESRLRRLVEFFLDNLFDLITIVVAASLVTKYAVTPPTQADIPGLANWILAVLALIAVSGIWDRNRRMRRIETIAAETKTLVRRSLSKEPLAQHFFRSDQNMSEELFSSAMKIVITGVTLGTTVKRLAHVLGERLEEGASIQIAILEPSESNLQQMVERGWGEATPDHYQELIDTTANLAGIIARSRQAKGKLELGYIPFYPSYAFRMIDPHRSHGICFVEILPHKSAMTGPVFKVKASDDPSWYEYLQEQFTLLWSTCRIERLPREYTEQSTGDT